MFDVGYDVFEFGGVVYFVVVMVFLFDCDFVVFVVEDCVLYVGVQFVLWCVQ